MQQPSEQTTPGVPLTALVLGLGGLIPFFSGALLTWLHGTVQIPTSIAPILSHDTPVAVYALGAYGAVILSFLGGVRWGGLLYDDRQLQRWLPLTLSVMPSLIAWPALLLPTTAMLVVLIIGFALQYWLDAQAARAQHIPPWFARLRLILTSGAIFSLLIALIAVQGS